MGGKGLAQRGERARQDKRQGLVVLEEWLYAYLPLSEREPDAKAVPAA
jgi:hypothetical protein